MYDIIETLAKSVSNNSEFKLWFPGNKWRVMLESLYESKLVANWDRVRHDAAGQEKSFGKGVMKQMMSSQ